MKLLSLCCFGFWDVFSAFDKDVLSVIESKKNVSFFCNENRVPLGVKMMTRSTGCKIATMGVSTDGKGASGTSE